MTGRPPKPVMQRLMSMVDKVDSGCWEYATRRRADRDYRQISVATIDGKPLLAYAHRVAYEHLVGPIANGLQIDHLCRNRTCVNPDHLEVVTPQENNKRRSIALVKECPQGHPYDRENTAIYAGRRHCKTCMRRRALARYYAKKESA